MPASALPESGPEVPEMFRKRPILLWTAVSLLGAVTWGVLALARGERISAVWLVIAALGSYAIAYRFYSRFIARRVLEPDDRRATPAERIEDGVDYHPTDRRTRRSASSPSARGTPTPSTPVRCCRPPKTSTTCTPWLPTPRSTVC
ncbi:hypothetical protein CA983_10320 [Streptomyces swartbergensis]|uniref:CstA N-terminal domain-containing protein n=1 Tax=Streptomyces swartbergensis TaxID=487165 RepID=A0A243S6X2_9ACTN|nr:hypothetical protein CA983_10320 [Streptomyces swartbergensis]